MTARKATGFFSAVVRDSRRRPGEMTPSLPAAGDPSPAAGEAALHSVATVPPDEPAVQPGKAERPPRVSAPRLASAPAPQKSATAKPLTPPPPVASPQRRTVTAPSENESAVTVARIEPVVSDAEPPGVPRSAVVKEPRGAAGRSTGTAPSALSLNARAVKEDLGGSASVLTPVTLPAATVTPSRGAEARRIGPAPLAAFPDAPVSTEDAGGAAHLPASVSPPALTDAAATVAMDRPLATTAATMMPSRSETAARHAPPGSRWEPAAPSVHIGVVEVVVAAPAEKRAAPAAAPAPPSNLASRRYLRRL